MRVLAHLALVVSLSAPVLAQSGVGVELEDVTDNRVGHEMLSGSLELRVKLTGNNLDRATAARIIVKDARDDRGTSLLPKNPSVPDFMGREYNMGTLQFSVNNPAREATSVKLKGTVELYVPTRDPNAILKIDKALAKLDAPLSSKGLKAAKLEITPLSPEGYSAKMKASKLDDAKIAQIREEGKKQGVPEKEIEMAIEFAKALDSIDEVPPAGSVILAGEKADFDRIYRVDLLGADGKPVDVGSRSSSTRGESTIMVFQPSSPPDATSALQFQVLTDKATVSFPFELKVPLP